jgi:cysteine desulfuration protein SufE
MTINEKQDAIIEEFACYDEWMDKYEYIIQLGKDLPVIDETYKTDDNLIKGCQSRVWLHASCDASGVVHFTADSDAIITKGLISLMIQVLTGQPANAIAQADIYFIDQIGLKSHLSPTRSNGLLSMLKQMKLYALAFSSQQQ